MAKQVKHIEKFKTLFRHAIGIATILVIFSLIVGMQNAIFFPSGSTTQKTITKEVIGKSLAEQIIGAKNNANEITSNENAINATNENNLDENQVKVSTENQEITNQNKNNTLTSNEQRIVLIKELESIALKNEKISTLGTDYSVSFDETTSGFELTFSSVKGNYLAEFNSSKNLIGVYRLTNIVIGEQTK